MCLFACPENDDYIIEFVVFDVAQGKLAALDDAIPL